MKTIKLTVIFGMILISSNLSSQVMANSKEDSSPVELSKGTSRYYYFPNLALVAAYDADISVALNAFPFHCL